ncbi:MAG: phasin family protein [Alphaproteobacteria bacterium]|nr:MAG: phasin family protein [Alphaproteobacteria bacterium]
MTTEIFETLNKLTQQTLENWKKLGETNLKIGQSLLSEQVELTTALVEATTKSAEETSKTKDVKEIAALQAELAQETGKLLMESARSTADIIAEAGKVYNQLFETSLKATSEYAGKASGKGKKAA